MPTNTVEKHMTEYLFSIYGTALTYSTASPLLGAPVNELLKTFRRDTLDQSVPLTLCFRACQDRADIPWTKSSLARQLAVRTATPVDDRQATGLPYEVIQDGGYLIADFQDVGVLVIDAVQGRADGYLIEPESMSANLIEYLFLSSLFQLLRRRGCYTIHAGALEKYGRGVLISGNSGRGKTTSIISLLRSGYRYLSDDHPLIRDAGTHVEVLPFPTMINVTDATIEFFPELRNAPDHVLHAGWTKWSFYAEDLYPISVGDCCQLAVILFPHVLDAPHSHLELLPKSRALELLLPQALLVYDPEVARREFQVLAKLVEQVDCYRLHFGRDVLELPRLITPLLEQKRG